MFSENCYFIFFYRISCITSSSGIAELPLCRPWARLTSPPKIRKSRKFTFLKIFGSTFSDFLDFSDFRWDVYRAHGRHSGSSAMPLAEVIHEIRLKNKKWNFSEKLYFFDEKYFSKDWWKIENFKKSTFFEKVDFFEKVKIFKFFFEKVDFLKILSFSTKIEKSDFLKFPIFQNLSKNIFHRKK